MTLADETTRVILLSLLTVTQNLRRSLSLIE